MVRIGAVWRQLSGSEEHILFEETLGLRHEDVVLSPERPAPPKQLQILEQRLCRLRAGEPLQYILGYWMFDGVRFSVGPGVLIAREDTLALCDLCEEFLKAAPGSVFADLGSGSGCIAVTLFRRCGAQGFAVERSEKAYPYLVENLRQTCGGVAPVPGNMFSPAVLDRLPQLDLVVSNPPYLTAAEMEGLPANVRHEPQQALYGGADGLDYYRKIIKTYPQKMRPGALLAFEVGYTQADAVRGLLREAGFEALRERRDLGGIRRAVGGVRPG